MTCARITAHWPPNRLKIGGNGPKPGARSAAAPPTASGAHGCAPADVDTLVGSTRQGSQPPDARWGDWPRSCAHRVSPKRLQRWLGIQAQKRLLPSAFGAFDPEPLLAQPGYEPVSNDVVYLTNRSVLNDTVGFSVYQAPLTAQGRKADVIIFNHDGHQSAGQMNRFFERLAGNSPVDGVWRPEGRRWTVVAADLCGINSTSKPVNGTMALERTLKANAAAVLRFTREVFMDATTRLSIVGSGVGSASAIAGYGACPQAKLALLQPFATLPPLLEAYVRQDLRKIPAVGPLLGALAGAIKLSTCAAEAGFPVASTAIANTGPADNGLNNVASLRALRAQGRLGSESVLIVRALQDRLHLGVAAEALAAVVGGKPGSLQVLPEVDPCLIGCEGGLEAALFAALAAFFAQ